MKPRIQLLAFLLLAAPLCAPAETTISFAPPGDHWLEWDREYENGVSHASYVKACGDAAAIDHFDQTLQRIATVWAQTPGMTNSGIYGQMRAFFSLCRGMNRGELSYWPWPPEDVNFRTGPSGRPTLKRGVEASPLRIEVNRLGGLNPVNEMNGSNTNGPFGLAQKLTRRVQGYPLYDDMVMIITAPGREALFKPATLDDALTAWMKVGPTSGWGRVEARQLYDSLDAAQRGRPAYLFDGGTRKIVTSPGQDIEPLYRYNGDYFDKSLPPHVAQIFKVSVHSIDIDITPDSRNVRYKLQRTVFESTDWHRIAAEMLH